MFAIGLPTSELIARAQEEFLSNAFLRAQAKCARTSCMTYEAIKNYATHIHTPSTKPLQQSSRALSLTHFSRFLHFSIYTRVVVICYFCLSRGTQSSCCNAIAHIAHACVMLICAAKTTLIFRGPPAHTISTLYVLCAVDV